MRTETAIAEPLIGDALDQRVRLRPRPTGGILRLQDEVTVLTLRHLPSFRVMEAATRRAVSRRQPAKSFITGSPPG